MCQDDGMARPGVNDDIDGVGEADEGCEGGRTSDGGVADALSLVCGEQVRRLVV